MAAATAHREGVILTRDLPAGPGTCQTVVLSWPEVERIAEARRAWVEERRPELEAAEA